MNISTLLRKSLCSFIVILSPLFTIMEHPLQAECMWKVDVGPAFAHIDVLESKQTIKKLDMPSVRGDASLILGTGWCVKPTILYGKARDGELVTFGVGVGRCLPICDRMIITPLAGVTYMNLTTSLHFDYGPYGKVKFRERIQSLAPYGGVEIILKIAKDWRLCASAQYAWSHAKTKIKNLLHSKSNAEGPNYGLLLEYDINCNWSVNVGAAYNLSLSREKDGLRGRGAKIGIARWF
ncbi:MAG: hypothetical protein ACE5GN_04765 [Waddliaceae bacterium]